MRSKKTIVITGATSGIGLAVAKELAKLGYNIIGIGHSEDKCKSAKEEIISSIPNAHIMFYYGDLMQVQEIMRIAELIRTNLEENSDNKLYALINNAGCARSRYTTTDEGFEQLFALNYLAAFLLTQQLFKQLINANGRIIMTGSEAHNRTKVNWNDIMLTNRYRPLFAYKQSKLCITLLAQALNNKYSQYGIHAYTVDPGLVYTDIGNKTGWLVGLVWNFRKLSAVQPDIPAKTYAYICEAEKPLTEMYYYLCKPQKLSKEVNDANAEKLFALSEQLCGVKYEEALQ